jgi:hypothetical protein
MKTLDITIAEANKKESLHLERVRKEVRAVLWNTPKMATVVLARPGSLKEAEYKLIRTN